MPISPSQFIEAADQMMGNAVGLSRGTQSYRFRGLFGISPSVCAIAWKEILSSGLMPKGAAKTHLLWALLFLKVYATEPVNRVISGADEKTFRKWSWMFVELLSNLNVPQMDWNTRLNETSGLRCFTSVDGTDFRICEPWPFDSKWYSHKFKGPGLRYEIGVSIGGGKIVWANGPFPFGKYSDLKIFQGGPKKALHRNEKVIADGGYRDERCVKLGPTSQISKFYSIVRARHETLNRRLKHFFVLGHRFRHHFSHHSVCFHAVCNLTELMIENNEPLFNIK